MMLVRIETLFEIPGFCLCFVAFSVLNVFWVGRFCRFELEEFVFTIMGQSCRQEDVV
jgi:hypothetical protein